MRKPNEAKQAEMLSKYMQIAEDAEQKASGDPLYEVEDLSKVRNAYRFYQAVFCFSVVAGYMLLVIAASVLLVRLDDPVYETTRNGIVTKIDEKIISRQLYE